MSRTATTKTVPAAAPRTLPDDDQRVEAAQDARALAVIEQDQRVTALAQQLNYNGSTDPAVLENSARDAIRRIGAGIFELGAYLLLMKEACGHGKFLPALERLGLEPRAAQQYMSITRRFAANTKSTSYLEGAGAAKLVELLPLNDEQVNDLTELGQTGELKLDDVANMSLKELRAAVRKERLAKQRLQEVGKELNAELVAIKARNKVIADTDWPDALAPVSDQVAAAGRKVATGMSELETCRITLFQVMQKVPDDQRPKFEAALAHIGGIYMQALQAAEKLVAKERLTFDKTLGAYTPEDDQ